MAVVAIVGDQQSNFQEQRTRVGQMRDTLARRELALAVLLLDLLRAAAGFELVLKQLDPGNQRAHVVGRSLGHFSIVVTSIGDNKARPLVQETSFERITVNPNQMGGVPCVRGLRIPVATVLRMLAGGMDERQILADYPDLQTEDIRECLRFAAASMMERELATPRAK